MFHTLAVFIVRRARWVLVAGLVALVGGVFLGMSAFDKLQTEGFDDPDSESSRAAALADEKFGGGADYVLLVDAGEGRADEGGRGRGGQRAHAGHGLRPRPRERRVLLGHPVAVAAVGGRDRGARPGLGCRGVRRASTRPR